LPRNEFEKSIERFLKKKKVKFKYEREKIPYVIAGHYIPDFIIETKLGTVYVEAKGYLRPEAKRKMVAVKRQHPEMDIRFVFYSRRSSQIKWADKHGFKWAIKEVPTEWLQGL